MLAFWLWFSVVSAPYSKKRDQDHFSVGWGQISLAWHPQGTIKSVSTLHSGAPPFPYQGVCFCHDTLPNSVKDAGRLRYRFVMSTIERTIPKQWTKQMLKRSRREASGGFSVVCFMWQDTSECFNSHRRPKENKTGGCVYILKLYWLKAITGLYKPKAVVMSTEFFHSV